MCLILDDERLACPPPRIVVFAIFVLLYIVFPFIVFLAGTPTAESRAEPETMLRHATTVLGAAYAIFVALALLVRWATKKEKNRH